VARHVFECALYLMRRVPKNQVGGSKTGIRQAKAKLVRVRLCEDYLSF
jgi:hypothetical protein